MMSPAVEEIEAAIERRQGELLFEAARHPGIEVAKEAAADVISERLRTNKLRVQRVAAASQRSR